jgi:hypothetical protein
MPVRFLGFAWHILLLAWSGRTHGAEQVFPGADWERDTNALPKSAVQELES